MKDRLQTEDDELSQIGLYIPAGVQPSQQHLERIHALGINEFFVESELFAPLPTSATHQRCRYDITATRPDYIISEVSPSSVIKAAKQGLPIVSAAATTPGGFNALATNWEIYERTAKKAGHEVNRDNWALVVPMHLARTRRQAQQEVKSGLATWLNRYRQLNNLGENESEYAVIGSRRDASQQIKRLRQETGGFGKLLVLLHGWAPFDATEKSLELLQEVVVQHQFI